MRSKNNSLLIILLLAFILRLLWIMLIDPSPVSDFKWYDDKGWDIAQGLGYRSGSEPTAYWPVGYPLILSAIYFLAGHSVFIAKLANIFLYLGIIVFTYLFSKRIFGNTNTAKISALILALWPNQIAYCALLSSEILFSFLFICASYILFANPPKIRNLISAGIVFGLSVLVKPVSLLFPLFGILIIKFPLNKGGLRGLLSSACLIYLPLLIVILPWTVRNYKALGHPILVSTNGGINLYIGNNKQATGFYVWDEEVRKPVESVSGEYNQDRLALRLALKHIADNPFKTTKLAAKKLFYLYKEDVDGLYWNILGLKNKIINLKILTPAHIIFQLYYVFTLISFIAGLVITLIKRKELPAGAMFGLLPIIYFTAVYMIFFGNPRFHFAIMPWTAIYAAYFITRAEATSREGLTLPYYH